MSHESCHSCLKLKPHPYTLVVLIFAGGARHPGYWSGKSWVVAGFEVAPAAWQPRSDAGGNAVVTLVPAR